MTQALPTNFLIITLIWFIWCSSENIFIQTFSVSPQQHFLALLSKTSDTNEDSSGLCALCQGLPGRICFFSGLLERIAEIIISIAPSNMKQPKIAQLARDDACGVILSLRGVSKKKVIELWCALGRSILNIQK